MGIKMKLIVTENPTEMELYGKNIVDEKKDIYSRNVLNTIFHIVRQSMPLATEERIQSIVYRTIYDYWMYGVSTDEWLYFGFEGRTHEDKLSFMTNRWKSQYIDHLNKKEDRYILENKYEAFKRLRSYFRRDVIEIEDENEYPSFEMFVQKHPSFIVKPGGLALSIGVYKVDEGSYESLQTLFDKIIDDNRKCTSNYPWSYSNGVVLEELIRQDKAMSALHPYSVNSVRITTVRVDDVVHIVHPWLKVGTHKNFVVCAALGTFVACINAETGIVETDAWLESRKTYSVHPDTHIAIRGFQIPKWDEAMALAKELAMSLDTLNYVGWDLVLTPDGWCVMEGNVYGDFMWQLCYDRGMRSEFEDLISWKSDKTFWWE